MAESVGRINPPQPEVPERSGGLGGLQKTRSLPAPSFAATAARSQFGMRFRSAVTRGQAALASGFTAGLAGAWERKPRRWQMA